ncbi:peptide-methionine (S)-S-oxide reductase [Mucilaginibacter sp. OK268]|jgi:peptide-methionine (S)-S-oxide reductase|uniref:peptide-methionine (S)-S-oxide reductase MsrA n=1 Tax=Mucilaginibacter sp. OK268 TaxID=1881048 RepID=UPI000884D719|nr:peptide-methionine (S)-S-oxide reductase MsrA [Mucilaginibacter sp. OK268]SDP99912.1 peptide-methionine (S)-S-oxide reductase [Mucilaginibacter sp. OK268]
MKKNIVLLMLFIANCAFAVTGNTHSKQPVIGGSHGAKLDTATFATGCFWCTEAKFQQLKGVKKVVSGFSGGHVANPTYEQVCTGTTGHAEACNIIYDPAQISFDELLEAFFVAHDPTQLNRQGNDVGTQYRSAIFYHNAAQKQKADYYISKLNTEKAYKSNIVTQVVPYKAFYKAEDYHQNYFNQNGSQPYCKYVIQPELEKFKKVFKNKLKS